MKKGYNVPSALRGIFYFFLFLYPYQRFFPIFSLLFLIFAFLLALARAKRGKIEENSKGKMLLGLDKE